MRALCLVAWLVAQGPVTKAKVTVDLVPGQPLVVVHVTNLSSRPIESWQVGLLYRTVAGADRDLDVTADTYASLAIPAQDRPSSSGPIAVGATRDRSIGLSDVPISVSATMNMVILDDLTSEGSLEVKNMVFAQREEQAANITIWLDTLQSAAGQSIQAARRTVSSRLATELGRVDRATDPTVCTLSQRVSQIVALADSNPSLFQEELVKLKAMLERQRQLALRHKAR